VCDYTKNNFENIVLILSFVVLEDVFAVGREVVCF